MVDQDTMPESFFILDIDFIRVNYSLKVWLYNKASKYVAARLVKYSSLVHINQSKSFYKFQISNFT